MSILIFPEGHTEDRVWRHFLKEEEGKLGISKKDDDKPFEFSKDRVYKQFENSIGSLLGKRPIKALLMVDWDAHNNQTPEREVQRLTTVIQNLLSKRQSQIAPSDLPLHPSFKPHEKHSNVYLLKMPVLPLHVALHIATKRWADTFIKSTIDDYILELALRPTTIANFLRHKRWEQPEPAEIVKKVVQEIPDLMRRNNIPLLEAKTYTRWFAALMQESTSPPIFASLVLKNAAPEDTNKVFGPLLAAIGFLREV